MQTYATATYNKLSKQMKTIFSVVLIQKIKKFERMKDMTI